MTKIMIPFFCLSCSEISISDERLLCSNCENDESGTVVTDNFNLPLPELENGSLGCNVPATDASYQNSEEYFKLVGPTREANTQMFEETSMAFDICNAATSLEVTDNTPASSQQSCSCEESSVGESENKNISDELLRTQGTTEHTEHAIQADKHFFTDSSAVYSKHPVLNLFPDSSNNVVDRRDKDNHHPSLSSCPRGNPSINKRLQEHLVSAKTVAQQEPQSSTKLSKRKSGKCKGYFKKHKTTSLESTGDPQVASQQQVYSCEQSSICARKIEYDSDELPRRQRIFEPAEPLNDFGKLDFTGSVIYESEYTIFKIFSYLFHNVEDRQEKVNTPSSCSSLCQRNQPINKRFKKKLVRLKTVAQQKPQSSSKLSKKVCEKCRRHFFKESTFYAHLQENCGPVKTYKCGQCGEIFSCISGLVSHRIVHTGEKPFKCNQCDYASAWPHNLKKHLETHTRK